jgi:uncharacterized membrane protein YhaH (DUF805 family)
MVSFPDAVKMFFARYVDFQGRSRRSEYWWVVLFNLIVFGVLGILLGVLGGLNPETGAMGPLGFVFVGVMVLYGLAIIIPSIALFIRRLHDINQTGWIYLGIVIAGFIPLLNIVASVAQIVIACIPGTTGPNKYGPDPKNPGGASADIFA